MSKVETYTSTGYKLLHHPDVISSLQKGKPKAITLQVAPTSRCNLNCIFCSNSKRARNEEINRFLLFETIIKFKSMGLKTVEWSGGGDPTLYPSMSELIRNCAKMGLGQGFITNGMFLKQNIDKKALDVLNWVRISMNCLDYTSKVDIPEIKGTLGFSYVMNDKTNSDILSNLEEHVKKYKPSYVRIVPDCQVSIEEQEINNKKLSAMVSKWGHPYFYQVKTFEKPKKCFWGYIKPFLLHDSWVYPCNSVVLNDTADKQFHEKFRWYHMSTVTAHYSRLDSYNTKSCDHCVFTDQNNILDGIINPNDMKDFV